MSNFHSSLLVSVLLWVLARVVEYWSLGSIQVTRVSLCAIKVIKISA